MANQQSPFYNAFIEYKKVDGFIGRFIVFAYREHNAGYEVKEQIFSDVNEERALKIMETYPVRPTK